MSNACLILSAAVLQGAKQVLIGDRLLRYDPAHCFIASLELPASGRVVEATPARPYVAISLMLDRDALADLLSILPDCPPSQATGFGVMPVTRTLLEAWHQFLTLFDTPDDAAVLAPLREREILYRLLQGPQAAMLRQIARADSRLSQVRHAVQWLQAHYDEKLRVDDLARLAGMSVPTFHRHFKAATEMSPRQVHRTIR